MLRKAGTVDFNASLTMLDAFQVVKMYMNPNRSRSWSWKNARQSRTTSFGNSIKTRGTLSRSEISSCNSIDWTCLSLVPASVVFSQFDENYCCLKPCPVERSSSKACARSWLAPSFRNTDSLNQYMRGTPVLRFVNQQKCAPRPYLSKVFQLAEDLAAPLHKFAWNRMATQASLRTIS